MDDMNAKSPVKERIDIYNKIKELIIGNAPADFHHASLYVEANNYFYFVPKYFDDNDKEIRPDAFTMPQFPPSVFASERRLSTRWKRCWFFLDANGELRKEVAE